jgi:hypothetical protein
MTVKKVLPIEPGMTHEWLLRVHYAKRIPTISYAFGLYEDDDLVGVVTYGTPSAAPLRNGLAGEDLAHLVLELNRLVFKRQVKNGASELVGKSLKLLPRPSIVVSYADTSQGHIGYVYQACNFLYTGLSAKRTDWKVKGMEHLHGQTIADMSKAAAGGERGARANFMREKFGDDFYLEDRPRKHRYIFVCGSKGQRAWLETALRYKPEPYPKGETSRYEISHQPAYQALLI